MMNLKQLKKLLKLGFLAVLLNPHYVFSETAPTFKQKLDKLYHTLSVDSNSNITTRLEKISAYFLGKPYVIGALGEGKQGRYDQTPLYQLDSFDCETYVTSMLALTFAQQPGQYTQCLHKLRYKNGQVSFINRNHFISLDWNQNNQKQGFVKDITITIKNEQNQPVFEMASALIDKPSWYGHFALSRIKLLRTTPDEQIARLNELKAKGKTLPIAEAKIPYIPLTVLFNEEGRPNLYLFKQIPQGAIIEIVRPNWDLTKQIGTHLNVSHLGFVFWQNGQPIFRQASSEYGKVVDVPLMDYLRAARSSPTIKGINIQVILKNKC